VPAVVIALLVGTCGVLIAWPRLRKAWEPVLADPIEAAASAYLEALVRDDSEAIRRLGTLDAPPAIRALRSARRDPARDQVVSGSFAPIAALHARIDKDFTYDPRSGRFETRNPLGAAADTLDALHAAKAKAEQDKIYEKMASTNLDEVVDAVTSYGRIFTSLAERTLAPTQLVPTYAQLVAGSKTPLPPAEQALALEFGQDRATWDALLRRPFLTLKADGPFRLERAEVTASVLDKLASSGAPPTTLRLVLSRFRLEGIDTGWRVTEARREEPPAPPTPQTSDSRYRSTTEPTAPARKEPHRAR
jgi:hypothetical protein